ncbi:solute carrier organic anion transporter family member 1A2-like [Eublepharis macularius]|uniref:Solute carrier organic anion transporter family member n=1 Tax=Eublepharis macularius TaxID=481883 RepID=A0AA97L797_EUBMA|nr:solute carrier organic anion transporter family member 1A2-like [Eublepharis macularius]XP_054844849.1 solute carrier organic anion transporter family member 1A2-like [Eublepharis macularius]XP_054844850.1 solute carrier organic anion transporter family member 1A2-like [Eublepharis macularius]
MDGKMVPEQAKVNANPPFLDKSHGLHSVKRFTLSVSKLKIFLGALAFSFFAKGLSGSYMKSMTTQIERRFDISSSIVGLIDGSFEIGNLMVLILVSYLGSKVHRPKVIAIGCVIMAVGAFISVAPHFIMGRYNYKSIAISVHNSSTSTAACLPTLSPHPAADNMGIYGNATTLGCGKHRASYLWLFVLVGNLLRGIGEAPIMPLGLSYIDDFSREENSAFYIGAVRSIGLFGPTLGFLLGAFCANMWVDIGKVDADSLMINSKDIRWVGAWWLGILICGAASFLASLPFWFLPRSLPKEGGERNIQAMPSDIYAITQDNHVKTEGRTQPPLKVLSAVKDFFLTVKKLLGNVVFMVFLLLNVLQYNVIVGSTSYEPKYMEQQFNISVSNAIFFIGIVLLPFATVGMFLGSFLIKRFKMGIKGMAKFACITFAVSYCFNLLYFIANCEPLQVAGLTVNYAGIKQPSFSQENLISSCNSDCNCEANHWDPVCGDNGVTYMSACLAGCKTSLGTGKDTVFHNCSCVGVSGHGNLSAILGQCPREKCSKMYPYFLAVLAISVVSLCLGATSLYMIMFRVVSPDLKSFGVGIETFCGRIFGGLPAPIYFGALIDRTCLKWGVKPCGGSGACRVYDTNAFRNIYLGLNAALKGGSFILYVVLLILILKRVRQDNGMGKVSQSTEKLSMKIPATGPGEPSSTETSVYEDTFL